jgi:hypothetical protein
MSLKSTAFCMAHRTGLRSERGPAPLKSAVLTQICASECKGKLAIVNPKRRGAVLHGEARKKRCSARLALQPCGFSTATRGRRRGFVLPMPRNLCIVLAGVAHENSDYLVSGAARTRTAGKAAGPECGPCATTRVQTSFSWTPKSARPFAVMEPLTTPYAW